MEPTGSRSFGSSAGFTLLELMIVAAILGILATIGVPMYQRSLLSARAQKAKEELRLISQAIDVYRLKSGGELPDSLTEVGHGGRLDPWGSPYCYLNIGTGAGDGMDWAIDAGLVDPDRVLVEDGGTRTDSLSLTAETEDATSRIKTVRLARVVPLVRASELTNVQKVAVLTAIVSVRRSDRFLFPLNSDYDLFSLGPNGKSAASIGAALAQDDVIRANDGDYFGPASEY